MAMQAEIARLQRLSQVYPASTLLTSNLFVVTRPSEIQWHSTIPPRNDLPFQILSSLRQLRLQDQIPQNSFQAKLPLLVQLVPFLQIKILDTFMLLTSTVSLQANFAFIFDNCILIPAVLPIYIILAIILLLYLFMMIMSLNSVHN